MSDVRWPWTRPDEEQRAELQRTEHARASMHALIRRLEVAVDRLEEVADERGPGSQSRD